jgi:hypothetical protein
LRSDCLAARRGDSDAPALATLIYNALTGRRFSSERDALQLPAPFATLVRAGLGGNGSLAAMRRVLSGPAITSAAVTNPAGAAVSSAAVSSAAVSSVAASSAAAAVPAAASESPTSVASPSAPRSAAQAAAIPRAELRKHEEEPRPRKRPSVAIAAIVLMAIALAVFWYATKRPVKHTPISGEAASQANPPQAAPAAVPPAATPAGDAAASKGAPETVKPAPRPSSAKAPTEAPPASSERSVWHVVAYTYTRESAAQRKATELAAQYPQLEPQVFAPSGHAPYLVALGGGMDREDAFARRDAARKAGMPSDTYAQNFRK